MSCTRFAVWLAAAVVCSSLVAGCGYKTDLELPPNPEPDREETDLGQ